MVVMIDSGSGGGAFCRRAEAFNVPEREILSEL